MNPAVIRRSFVVLGLLATASLASAQALQGKLQGLIGGAKLGSAKVGVVIMDPESDTVLAAYRGDDSFIPASNMKLLTSGSALTILGADFTFKTQLIHQPEAGNRIIVKGAGDPAFGDPELLETMKLTVDNLLEAWVQAVKKACPDGIGELVIDDRAFDREYVHPTWPVGQLNRWYCAEVSGLSFHTNVLAIFAKPRSPGQPPSVTIEPRAPWIEVQNRARSIKTGQQTAWAARSPESNSITLNGDVRYGNDPIRVTIHDNANFFSRLLADRLTRAGLPPRDVRVASENEDLQGGTVIHTIATALDTALARCNEDSHNLYAECFIKRMGHEISGAPGSWRNGASVIRMAVNQRLGEGAARDLLIADGSGMSRENKVSPMLLAEWLTSFHHDERLGPLMHESLPIGGREGTLDDRFKARVPKNEVRAKSGYLTGVSALSGFVTHPSSGRRVVFSIITNDKPNSVATSSVREFEERVVLLADQWLTQHAEPERQLGGR